MCEANDDPDLKAELGPSLVGAIQRIARREAEAVLREKLPCRGSASNPNLPAVPKVFYWLDRYINDPSKPLGIWRMDENGRSLVALFSGQAAPTEREAAAMVRALNNEVLL